MTMEGAYFVRHGLTVCHPELLYIVMLSETKHLALESEILFAA